MGCGKGGNAEPCHIKATLKRKDNLRPPQKWTAVARRVNLPMTHAATTYKECSPLPREGRVMDLAHTNNIHPLKTTKKY